MDHGPLDQLSVVSNEYGKEYVVTRSGMYWKYLSTEWTRLTQQDEVDHGASDQPSVVSNEYGKEYVVTKERNVLEVPEHPSGHV